MTLPDCTFKRDDLQSSVDYDPVELDPGDIIKDISSSIQNRTGGGRTPYTSGFAESATGCLFSDIGRGGLHGFRIQDGTFDGGLTETDSTEVTPLASNKMRVGDEIVDNEMNTIFNIDVSGEVSKVMYDEERDIYAVEHDTTVTSLDGSGDIMHSASLEDQKRGDSCISEGYYIAGTRGSLNVRVLGFDLINGNTERTSSSSVNETSFRALGGYNGVVYGVKETSSSGGDNAIYGFNGDQLIAKGDFRRATRSGMVDREQGAAYLPQEHQDNFGEYHLIKFDLDGEVVEWDTALNKTPTRYFPSSGSMQIVNGGSDKYILCAQGSGIYTIDDSDGSILNGIFYQRVDREDDADMMTLTDANILSTGDDLHHILARFEGERVFNKYFVIYIPGEPQLFSDTEPLDSQTPNEGLRRWCSPIEIEHETSDLIVTPRGDMKLGSVKDNDSVFEAGNLVSDNPIWESHISIRGRDGNVDEGYF